MRPLLPESHPWKHKFFSLADWSQGRTSLCAFFDDMFWMFLIFTVAGAVGFWVLQ